jgi:hypothetical protein
MRSKKRGIEHDPTEERIRPRAPETEAMSPLPMR